MLAGDYLETFDDIRDPAAQPRWSGSAPAVNVMKGFEAKDPFAYSFLEVESGFPVPFPEELTKLNMLKRAINEPWEVLREINQGKWKRVEAVVAFMSAARGPTPYTELHVLAHSMAKPTLSRRYYIGLMQSRAPWLPASAVTQLKAQITASEYEKLASEGVPGRFFSTVVSNGYYFQLALNNNSHFAPDNWKRFSDDHRAALNLVKDHVTSGSAQGLTAPVPAEAIARTAFSLHYLTDAFASGHMRVPRNLMGINGSFASGVMHDVDNEYGLVVKNGLGDTWRAFGDGYLNPTELIQEKLLNQLAIAGGQSVNAKRDANYFNAIRAVGSALMQLHYEAQRHKDEANAAPFKPVLENMRLPDHLMGDNLSFGVPGDGGYSDWLTQNIDAKVAYMEKHRPRPVGVGPSALENHPPLYDPSGNVSKKGYVWYEFELEKLGKNKVLRLSWHGNKKDFDYTENYNVGLLMDGLLLSNLRGGWLPGRETWVQALHTQLPEITGPPPWRAGGVSRGSYGTRQPGSWRPFFFLVKAWGARPTRRRRFGIRTSSAFKRRAADA
jgi:hypothetical protein